MINYTMHHSGPLIFQTKLNETEVSNVLKLCKKDKSLDARKKLVGSIDHEYDIKDLNKLTSILKPYLNAFLDAHKRWYASEKSIHMSMGWVNYMTAGDFNPMHIHSDCDFSSVLFLKVPKNLEKEQKEAVVAFGSQAGCLNFFIHSPTKGYIPGFNHNPKPGDFFIFPSTLNHSVNPFKSKGERISVACNFVYD